MASYVGMKYNCSVIKHVGMTPTLYNLHQCINHVLLIK